MLLHVADQVKAERVTGQVIRLCRLNLMKLQRPEDQVKEAGSRPLLLEQICLHFLQVCVLCHH